MPIFLFFSPSSPEQYIVTNCLSFTFHFQLHTLGFIKLLFSWLVSISLFFQVFSLLNYFLSIHSFLSQLSLLFTPFFFLFPCLSFSLFRENTTRGPMCQQFSAKKRGTLQRKQKTTKTENYCFREFPKLWNGRCFQKDC